VPTPSKMDADYVSPATPEYTPVQFVSTAEQYASRRQWLSPRSEKRKLYLLFFYILKQSEVAVLILIVY
jgi:hypothetical protein